MADLIKVGEGSKKWRIKPSNSKRIYMQVMKIKMNKKWKKKKWRQNQLISPRNSRGKIRENQPGVDGENVRGLEGNERSESQGSKRVKYDSFARKIRKWIIKYKRISKTLKSLKEGK